mmetsp:Transcript_12594/g.24091  ORF Transcript_12594/g.24091 Transcript_12594/m.24091 type:complete len:143 (-) Transcript_12594:577-1005(-)
MDADSIQSETLKDLKSKGVSKERPDSKLIIVEESREPSEDRGIVNDAPEPRGRKSSEQAVKKVSAKPNTSRLTKREKTKILAKNSKLPESKKATIKKTRGKAKPTRIVDHGYREAIVAQGSPLRRDCQQKIHQSPEVRLPSH